MNQPASGILLHPTSLSNPYPGGDLGPAATVFAEIMVKSGQRCWQMIPIGPTGEEDSPYQSLFAFEGNPLLVSPDQLVEQGLLGRQDIEISISKSEGKVNYPAAAPTDGTIMPANGRRKTSRWCWPKWRLSIN